MKEIDNLPEVPAVVHERVLKTLACLTENDGRREESVMKKRRFWNFSKRGTIAACIAALLVVGSTAVYAATHWNSPVSRIEPDASVKSRLEDANVYKELGMSQTCNGVTVTADKILVDERCARLIFKIDGFDFHDEAGAFPGFTGAMDFMFDDGDYGFNGGGGFEPLHAYNEDGSLKDTFDDGCPLTFYKPGYPTPHYWDKNGSCYFNYGLRVSKPGELEGRTLHVNFEDLELGYAPEPGSPYEKYADAESGCIPDDVLEELFPGRTRVEGKWSFDIPLCSTDTLTQKYDISQEIGDTGAVVSHVELSPISIYFEYDCDKFNHEVLDDPERAKALFEKDREEFQRAVTVPIGDVFYGVRLADGSVYKGISSSGGGGFDPAKKCQTRNFLLTSVIDPEKVVSIFFINTDMPNPENAWEPYPDEALYEVPLK